MVSYFQGCNNIVTSMLIFVYLFFLCLLCETPGVTGRNNPLVQLSSSEDLLMAAGYGEEKLSTVLISGTVLCQTCSHDPARTSPEFVSGAVVGVSCQTSWKTSKSNWKDAATDEFGDFVIDLPSHLHAIPFLENRCVVKVLSLPNNSPCRPSFTGEQAGLKLISSRDGIRNYSAENIYLTRKKSHGCTSRTNKEEDIGILVKTN